MNRTNLLIDTGIFLAFIVAMEPGFSGIPVHEWLSAALGATIIVHLLLHWNWIAAVATRFFKSLWHTSRLKFFVDVLLFIAFTAVMLSGILISKAILPSLGIRVQENMVWRQLHSLTADLSILLLGLHFALSWKWVVTALKRFLVEPVANLVKKPGQQPAPVAVNIDEES